ncbi:MAG: hypothetical protein ACRDJH_25835 [Thermomicrobiales bacterium]
MAMTDALYRAKRVPSREAAARVEPDPHRPGPDRARLVNSGIPVSANTAHLQGLDGDVSAVARDYMIPEEEVVAAIAYYLEHRAAIDARIALNAAAA